MRSRVYIFDCVISCAIMCVFRQLTKCHNNQEVKWNYWQCMVSEFDTCNEFEYSEGRLHLNFDYDQSERAIDIVIVLEIGLKIAFH